MGNVVILRNQRDVVDWWLRQRRYEKAMERFERLVEQEAQRANTDRPDRPAQ